MSLKNITQCEKLLNRVKSLKGIKTDLALAEYLDVVPSTIYGWRKKGRADYNLILEKFKNLDFDIVDKEQYPITPEQELIITQRQALDFAQDKIALQQWQLEELRKEKGKLEQRLSKSS